MKPATLLVILSAAASIPGALSAPHLDEAVVPTRLEELLPAPVRDRRDLSLEAVLESVADGGTRVDVEGSGALWQDQDSRLDGYVNWARTFGGSAGGSPSYGGGLSFADPRGNVALDMSRALGRGTYVAARGAADLWRSSDGRSKLAAAASWSRNFGGPPGSSKPKYSASIAWITNSL